MTQGDKKCPADWLPSGTLPDLHSPALLLRIDLVCKEGTGIAVQSLAAGTQSRLSFCVDSPGLAPSLSVRS